MDEWISVKERLPEVGLLVIVTDGQLAGTGWFVGNEWRAHFPLDSRSITHWMPLPEPPEEVNDGNYMKGDND